MGYGNILKQLNIFDAPPCTFCGGDTRITAAMTGYIKAHGRNYDVEKFSEYRTKVRRLSERTYKIFKNQINPLGHKRGSGKNDYHLDHKFSIIACFKNAISESAAASLHNLELLPASENLKKGRTNSITAVTDTIPEVFIKLRDDTVFEFISDFENVFETSGKLLIRQSELINSPKAVLARVRSALGKAGKRINIEGLTRAVVDKETEQQFLTRWHLSGYTQSHECLGLWLNGHLISMMSFEISQQEQKKPTAVLLRFCTHGEFSVADAQDTLWESWTKLHPRTQVLSYGQVRFCDDALYKKLGFAHVDSVADPRYFWFSDQQIKGAAESRLKAAACGAILADVTIKIADPGVKVWKYCATQITAPGTVL